MKRSKNIFNSPIAPESLLEEEGNKEFQVGGLSITSNWLVGVNPLQYPKYILSSLYLSELERELNDLKEENQKYQGNMRQSNLFKIGHVKKKIKNFTLKEVEQKEKPLGEQSLIKNQPPDTSNLRIQKIGGFFKGIIERKCKIQDKQLYIESQKDDKTPWLTLGIAKYTIQLELKQHSIADNKQEFKEFVWPASQNFRLLLWGKQIRPHCIYGSEQQLKKFQRYFQVENIEMKQLGVFKKLDTQFQQKIITIFGNKVRFYDHNLRQRKAEKEVQYNTISKNADNHDWKREETASFRPVKETSDLGQSSEVGQSSQLGRSGLLDPDLAKSNVNTSSQVMLDGRKSPQKLKLQSKQKINKSEIFKLKVKGSVVFYDEIEEPFHFEDQANYSVTDIKLNLKEEIGISDIDEEESVGGLIKKGGKKVIHMSVKNALDESQKFNINIHQASSLKISQDQNGSFDSEIDRLSVSSKHAKSLNLSQIKEPNVFKKIKRLPSQVDSLLDQFELQNMKRSDIYNDLDSEHDELEGKENIERKPRFLIRDLRKKKQGQIEIFQKLRPPDTYFSIQEIEMLVPYHKETLNFEILQIDPNLEIQRKIVICGKASSSFQESKSTTQRYTSYSIERGFHFRISKDSDEFIFVLKQEGRHHYLRFDVDPMPKYQRNCSQLLITKLDKEGFPFACSLVMFASPFPIELKPPLSTLQFMVKYLNEGQDYDLKLDFIDDKRKRFLIKRQWNKLVFRNIIRSGDAQAFARGIFRGMSDTIFSKLKKNLQYSSERLFYFSENQLRMLEENISTQGIMDLRVFMKPSSLIKYISQSSYNKLLKERLQQIYVYFLKRYGSIRNLALIFIKEILAKIQPIIVMGRKQQQVYALVDLYFEVEYEIDELFQQISKYFKK